MVVLRGNAVETLWEGAQRFRVPGASGRFTVLLLIWGEVQGYKPAYGPKTSGPLTYNNGG